MPLEGHWQICQCPSSGHGILSHFRMANKDTKALNKSDLVISSVAADLSQELNMEEDRIVNNVIFILSS